MSPSAALEYLAGSLLFIGGIGLLFGAAWIFARALADVYRAKSHRLSAETQQEVVEAAQDALDDIHDRRAYSPQPPTDAELRAFARAGVESDRVTSSLRTDNGEEEPAIPPDYLYVRTGGEG